jgi:hypothetical protein
MKFKIFATDDWLARHPKVIVLIMIALMLLTGYFEEIK